jgi:hypothetical protein
VKKLSLHEFYNFGKNLCKLSEITHESKLKNFIPSMWVGRQSLLAMIRDDSPLLETARRACVKLIKEIDEIIPRDIDKVIGMDAEKEIGWLGTAIPPALTELESVLGNDMPGIAAYLVSKKGIYNTDDLIAHADNHLVPEIRALLPAQAAFDLCEAGKCLAYELSTGCAFHLWRAVETVIELYYEKLTGKTFEVAKIPRNWGAYIKALEVAGADAKVTSFLDHIRDKYRNPQTHPTVKVELNEAQGLFGVAMSSIDQMISEIKNLLPKAAVAALAGP